MFNVFFYYFSSRFPRPDRMQTVCSPLDTSQLLRDILKSKEQHFENSNNNSDNNSTNSNNSILIKDNIFPASSGCETEMISPLLHSKSSDMAYTDRDGHDNDIDHDNDGNAAVSISNMSNNSSFNGRYQSRMDFDDCDDDEDRSHDLSMNRRKGNNDDDDDINSDRRILKIPVSSSPQNESETNASSSDWESKEAKRAHVENILSSMRQSPPATSLAGSEDATGDPSPTGNVGKRQKRKQPQPQQHDTSVSSLEDQLHFQVDQKRSRIDRGNSSPEPVALDASAAKIVSGGPGDNFSVNGDLDEPIVDDSDTDVEDSAEDLAKPFSGQNANDSVGDKRAGVDHILNGLQASPAVSNGSTTLASPLGESSKKQKRKQTQPQQHENSQPSGNREERRQKFDDNHNKSSSNNNTGHFFGLKHGNTPDSSLLSSNHLTPDHNMANFMGADALLRKSLFRGMSERDFIPPYHGGFDPNLYRDNLFRQSLFGLRPDLDPMAAFRNLPKNVHGIPEPLMSPEENSKMPSAAELVKIASALKTELKQAVNKAIDSAVSKVLNEKQVSASNADRFTHITNSGPEQQQQQQSHIDRQNQSRPKSVPSPKLLPNFLLPHHPLHQNLQHPQQHPLQQQHPHAHQQVHQLTQRGSPPLPANPAPVLESAKENVDSTAANAGTLAQQSEKKPELIVPFSDHLHILERFGNRLHQQQQQQHPLHLQQQQQQDQDKMSAFDPVTRVEREGEGQQHQLITPHTGPAMTFHPHFPYYLPAHALPPGLYPGMAGTGVEPEQTEALPLIVSTPKKKRTKVTDTRLSSPRGNTTTTSSTSTTPNNGVSTNNNQSNGNNNSTANNNNNSINNNNNTKSSLLQDNTPSSSMDNMDSLAQRHLAAAAAAAAAASSFPHFLPPVLPTSVAITNPSLSHSDLLTLRLREAGFPDARIPSPSDHGRGSSPRSPSDSPHFMSKMDLYERGALSMPGDHLMDMGGPGAPHPISFSDNNNLHMISF